ncbi:MAG: T9SS type A sorting domain-containing protein [Clostridiales bacterium]
MIRNTTLKGDLIWEKYYGGSLSEGATKILKKNSNNYLVLGGTASTDGDVSFNPYPGSPSFWYFTIDSTGDILWDKVIGGLHKDVLMDGIISSDSGIVSIGWIEGGGGEITNYYGERDIWAIKTDMEGNKLWDFTVGTSSIDFGYCVIETHDKGYLLGGSSLVEEGTGGNITCQAHGYEPEAVLFKLDSLGNYEWQRCYGGSEIEVIHKLAKLPDGYLLGCTGYSDDGDMAGSGYHTGYYHTGGRTPDIWLVKIDYYGNIVWQKCYGGTQTEAPVSLYALENGNILVFGSTTSFDGDVVGNHSINEYNPDIWLFEIDTSGKLLWQKCIGGSVSEGMMLSTYSKNDYDYIITSSLNGLSNGDINCVPNYNYNYGIWLFELTDSTLTVRENEVLNFSLYPNPVNELLDLEFPLKSFGQIAIYDILGTERLTRRISDDKIILDFNNYPNGIYLIKYFNDKGQTATKKIIVSHTLN